MNESINKKQGLYLGFIFMVVATMSYTLMSVQVKIIGHRLPISEVVFSRFFVCLLCTLPWLFAHPKKVISTTRPWLLLLRSLCGTTALACFFFSIRYIPLVDAVLLINLSPFIVPVILFVLYRHKVARRIYIGIAVGFVGVFFVLSPSSHIFSWAALLAIFASFLAACSKVTLKALTKTESIKTMLFYFFLIGSLLPIIFMRSWIMPNLHLFFWLLGMGLTGAVWQFLLTRAIFYLPTEIFSPLLYLTVLFSALADWLVWQRTPSVLTWSGVTLIIIAVAVLVRPKKNLAE